MMVTGGAHMIGSSTSQITAAADDLSRRTEQQAASLEETVAVLSQLAQSVKKNSEGAAQASALVSKTKSDAESSGGIVREAVNAMGRIAKSSSEISQIISVIDEISFQTNLLALNAGVEAARAGDAGRGFAVVASEVRALAQRCAQAAKEINTLIASATNEVREGVELLGHAGKALETIVVQVGDINAVVAEIASSAKEQATSLAEVNVAITQMDQDTQKNAAMVEETTAASHNVRQKTEELVRSVGAFRVEAASQQFEADDQSFEPAPPQPRARRAAMLAIVGNTARKLDAQPSDDWEEF
jgi:methyl-accepting chemotaxis protein